MIGWEPKITKVIYSWVEGHFLPTSGLFPDNFRSTSFFPRILLILLTKIKYSLEVSLTKNFMLKVYHEFGNHEHTYMG